MASIHNHGLTTTDLAAVRGWLMTRARELVVRGEHVHDALAEPISADSGEAAVEREDDEALASEEALIARELRAVQIAIARIDTGSWGECTRCGDSIDPRRLSAQPEATLCINCASAQAF